MAATNVMLGNASTCYNWWVNTATHNAPASYPLEVTTVLWTVTDIHGNNNTANQTVTVVDTEKPHIKAPGTFSMVNDAGTCGRTILSIGTPRVSDNCGVASVTNDAPASHIFPVGTTIVTWTVTDIHGNVTDTAKQ